MLGNRLLENSRSVVVLILRFLEQDALFIELFDAPIAAIVSLTQLLMGRCRYDK